MMRINTGAIYVSGIKSRGKRNYRTSTVPICKTNLIKCQHFQQTFYPEIYGKTFRDFKNKRSKVTSQMFYTVSSIQHGRRMKGTRDEKLRVQMA